MTLASTGFLAYIDGMIKKTTLPGLLKGAFVELMKDIGTSIPGHLLGFNPDTGNAQLQIGVQKVDVNGVSKTPPPLIECPVYHPGGSDYFVEYQLDPGAEGWIVFSQRCIDGWVNTGGVANNPVSRYHDLSDACFFPGIRSQAGRIIDHANEGIRLRNAAGTRYVWIKASGLEIAAPGENVNIISATLTHNGVNVGDTHVHDQPSDSNGDTEQPTEGPH